MLAPAESELGRHAPASPPPSPPAEREDGKRHSELSSRSSADGLDAIEFGLPATQAVPAPLAPAIVGLTAALAALPLACSAAESGSQTERELEMFRRSVSGESATAGLSERSLEYRVPSAECRASGSGADGACAAGAGANPGGWEGGSDTPGAENGAALGVRVSRGGSARNTRTSESSTLGSLHSEIDISAEELAELEVLVAEEEAELELLLEEEAAAAVADTGARAEAAAVAQASGVPSAEPVTAVGASSNLEEHLAAAAASVAPSNDLTVAPATRGSTVPGSLAPEEEHGVLATPAELEQLARLVAQIEGSSGSLSGNPALGSPEADGSDAGDGSNGVISERSGQLQSSLDVFGPGAPVRALDDVAPNDSESLAAVGARLSATRRRLSEAEAVEEAGVEETAAEVPESAAVGAQRPARRSRSSSLVSQ